MRGRKWLNFLVGITLGEVVSLVRIQSSQQQIADSISEALNLIDFRHGNPVESVVIKPNLCYYWDAATGYTTDPRVVAGIIGEVRERFGGEVNIRVVEADATAMQTKYAFLALEYEKLANEMGVELINLSNAHLDERKVKVNRREIKFKVPQLLINPDLFINVPKLKIMRGVGISCALKNLFGCIGSPRKIVYHPFLEEAIVGINKILRPHLTVVDGLVALGRSPVKLGLIMASADPFSIDWIASQIMGYNPSSLGFLRIAMKEKLGSPEGVTTRGEVVKAFQKDFPKENFFSQKLWNIQLRLLNLYLKIVDDVAPPPIEEL